MKKHSKERKASADPVDYGKAEQGREYASVCQVVQVLSFASS
jgi:hypothetical protein